MASIVSPEVAAIRGQAEKFLGADPGRGNGMNQLERKYTTSIYRQKMRDIVQLGKDVPVTILNMNPFPLKINGGVLFPEEIAACPVGSPYTTHVLREIRWQSKDNGCDAEGRMQMEPMPYIPLMLAAEYIREFVQADYAFGGVCLLHRRQAPYQLREK